MGTVTIVLEPKDCGEECKAIREALKKQFGDEVSMIFLNVEEGEGLALAKVLKLEDIKEPKAIQVSDLKDVITVDEEDVDEDGSK